MIEREIIMKWFNLIECQHWQKFFDKPKIRSKSFQIENGDISDSQNLMLNECIISFEQLENLEMVQEKLKQIQMLLNEHFSGHCPKCDDILTSRDCQVCMKVKSADGQTVQNKSKKKVQPYDIYDSGYCPICNKFGHRDCIEHHLKTDHKDELLNEIKDINKIRKII